VIVGFRHKGLERYWSIRVSGNWRITFRFLGNYIELVGYLDCH
jgi:proteic killer suppression protein